MADNSRAAPAEFLSGRRAALLAEARKHFAQLADTNNPLLLKTEIGKLLKRANLGYETLDPSGRSTATTIRQSIDSIVALQGLQDPGDPEPRIPPFFTQGRKILSASHANRHLRVKLALCLGIALAGVATFVWSEYPETFQAVVQGFIAL